MGIEEIVVQMVGGQVGPAPHRILRLDMRQGTSFSKGGSGGVAARLFIMRLRRGSRRKQSRKHMELKIARRTLEGSFSKGAVEQSLIARLRILSSWRG